MSHFFNQFQTKSVLQSYRQIRQNREFRSSVLGAFFLCAVSLVASHFAKNYVDNHTGNVVSDLLLDHLPVMNVNFIVNEGVWTFISFILFFLFLKPQKLPFILKSLALFWLIRSAFVTFTHIGPVPQHSFLNPHDWLSAIASGNDLFFSGHTGAPFLMALVFWENKLVRYGSILASIVFGFSMIVGHLHYSIDVFSAFFITYSIFRLAVKFFPKDYRMANS